VPEVRLIDEDGKQLGVMPTDVAIERARYMGIDVIEVAGSAKPPVCRLGDFGKYQYHQNKKLRKQKAHSKTGEIKAVRIGLGTAKHDLEMRFQIAKKFMAKGQRVKVELKLIGRQKGQVDLAREKIQTFLELFGKDNLKIIQPLKRNPRGMEIIIDKIT